jgi:hypothetical protein
LLVLTFLSLGRSTAADREPAAVGIELDFVQRDHPRVVKECVNCIGGAGSAFICVFVRDT